MELRKTIVLKSKGDWIQLKPKGASAGPFHATLIWKTAVDLDLHCFYRLRSDALPPESTGLWSKLRKATTGPSQDGHINYAEKGSKDSSPWITLDHDAGVGDVGGDNEENMHFWDIDKIESALIVANIFSKDTNFAKYNGRVVVEGGGQKFEVPLSETKRGSWCIVAKIDNLIGNTQLINVNQTQGEKPDLNTFRSLIGERQ